MAEYAYGWINPQIDYDAKIIVQADRAIALAPENGWAHYAKGMYLDLSDRANEAFGAADAGLAVNPNFALLYGARAIAETSLGHFEQAKSDLRQAMRLSPREPRIGLWYMMLSSPELEQGHYEAAIEELQRAIDAGYRPYTPYAKLAAAYALDGKMDEAKSALAEARRLNPDLTVKWSIAHSPNLPHLFEGLRKAGLPEE